MMRLSKLTIAAAMLLAAGAAAAADKGPEERLAEVLKGRVAGKPVDCIRLPEIRSSKIFDRTAILYEMNNGTYYLNRPRNGANQLRWSQILVTETHGSDLCSIDIVKLYESGSQMQQGFVGLDKFVPYVRPKDHKGH